MFIRSNVHMHNNVVKANVRKTVYTQECMNDILLQCYH